ncbi:hypothetical protein BK60_13775 [Neisseria gonorrhoeae]|nr:hypothetical protein BK60_13775 [Neisseria gonorrhoeae]
MQGLEAQSIYYFHRNGRPRPPCKPLKDKPPGLIRAAVDHVPAVDLSRQVDGRCLVLILSVSLPSSLTASLGSSALSRLTGCPQNHFTEPSSRLAHRESFLPLISLFTPVEAIVAVTTPFATSTF